MNIREEHVNAQGERHDDSDTSVVLISNIVLKLNSWNIILFFIFSYKKKRFQ